MALGIATLVHIAAGSTALAAAPVAILSRKGGPAHRGAGKAFVAAMALMALSGGVLGFLDQDRATGLVGFFTFSLIATAWAAAQRPLAAAPAALMTAAAASASLCAGFIATALFDPKPVYQSIVPFIFAGLVALALSSDLWRLARPKLSEPGRIARHLWRMMLALTLAAASFFIGQQKVFPEAIKGWAIWYAPPLLSLLALAVWMIKVRVMPRQRRAQLNMEAPAA
jgi:uncharacterized membrane protein